MSQCDNKVQIHGTATIETVQSQKLHKILLKNKKTFSALTVNSLSSYFRDATQEQTSKQITRTYLCFNELLENICDVQFEKNVQRDWSTNKRKWSIFLVSCPKT